MTWLGLTAPAWTIVLVAVATYGALLSGWFLALPTVRGAALQAELLLLTSAAPPATEEERTIQADAIANIHTRLIQRVPRDRRSIRAGWVLLFVSLVVFSLAVALQAGTDPAFRAGAIAPG